MPTNDTTSGTKGSAALLGTALALLIVAAVAGTLAARSRWWLPPLASAQGRPIDQLFFVTFGIISVAFVLVHGLLALFVWLYRDRGQRASYWHENLALELTYTIIPAIVMTGLTLSAAGLWSRIHSAPPPQALVVEVRGGGGERWGWRPPPPGPEGNFGRIPPRHYSARENPWALDPADPAAQDDLVLDISTTGELHLVVDRPVEVRIRAKDVLHSFFIPAFRVKQDAVPGMKKE